MGLMLCGECPLRNPGKQQSAVSVFMKDVKMMIMMTLTSERERASRFFSAIFVFFSLSAVVVASLHISSHDEMFCARADVLGGRDVTACLFVYFAYVFQGSVSLFYTQRCA